MNDPELIKKVKLFSNSPPESLKDAINFQKQLSGMVSEKRNFKTLNTIAGADVAVLKREKKLICGIIVFSYPGLEILEKVCHVEDEKFPYIPTLLAFREGPAILRTFEKIKSKPDLLMIDGQGTAHPRNFGIACYIGVILNIPVIGVAKKRLFGEYTEPGSRRGEFSALRHKTSGKKIGAVLRTRDNVKPVFISPGNNIDLDSAVKISLECSRGLRIPEPTRLADKYVAELKKKVVI